MGILTSGKITYGRTVQPAQYESKKAEAEICFTAQDDGSDFDAMLAIAAATAIEKVHEMVGLKSAKAAPTGANTTGPSGSGGGAHAPAAAPATGRTKQDIENEKMAELNAAKAPAATPRVPRAAAKPKAEEPKPQITTNPEDRVQPEADDSFDDFSDAAPVVAVTDADLTAACTKANGVIKDGIAIRGLATECGATTGVSSIPNERRQEFLNKLEALKKDKTPAKAA